MPHLPKRTWHLSVLAGLAAALVVAIGLPSCTGTTSPNPSLPPIPVSTVTIDSTIGPEGGTLTHPSGAQLIVPAGALPAATHLTFTGIAAPPAEVLGGTPLGQGYEAGPEGQTFLKPVDIVLPFDPTRVPAGTDAATAQLRMAPHGSTAFVALQSTVDLAGRSIRASTIHFTQFVPAQNPNPVIITTDPLLPSATVGTPYAQTLAAAGGTPPYTWSLSLGSVLPPGLTLAPTGSLAGTPSVPSAFEFSLSAVDSASHAVQMAFTLSVAPATNPLPVLSGVAPTSALQGSAATAITLRGADFVPSSQALWDGAPIPTTFVSATQLGASIPPSALAVAGTHQVSVSSPPPGGGTSASIAFTVIAATPNPVPTIAGVSPNRLPLSAVDTQIAVTGTNFIASSSVAIGAQGIPTTYVSPTQLTATVPAAYLGTAGTLAISVYNPPPGGGFSPTNIPVTIGALNPVPTLASLSPSSVVAGSATFTLNATGANFLSSGQMFFGSTALATTVSSATSASASVPASLVATPGSVQVTFVNPPPGGGATGALTFSISDMDGGVDASADTDTDAPVCVAPPAPAPCGALGGPCCGGSTCNASLTCLNGVCAEAGSCGGAGQPCCPARSCGLSLTCNSTDHGDVCGGGSDNMPGGRCSVCLSAQLNCGLPNGPAGTCQTPGSECARTGISTGICTAPTLPPPSCVLHAGCTPASTSPVPGGGCCDPQAVCAPAVGQPYNLCCRLPTFPCTTNSDCCSGTCTGGYCPIPPAGTTCASDAYCGFQQHPTCNLCSQTCCAQGTWPGNGC